MRRWGQSLGAFAAALSLAVCVPASGTPDDPTALEADLLFDAGPNAFSVQLYSYRQNYTVDTRAVHVVLLAPGGRAVSAAHVVLDGVVADRHDPNLGGPPVPGTRFVQGHVLTAGLPAGLYMLTVSCAPVVGKNDRGEAMHVARRNAAISIWVAPPPDAAPAVRVGAEFYFDELAPQIDAPAIARLTEVRDSVRGRRYTFATELFASSRDITRTFDADAVPTEHVNAIVSDAGLARARARYEGRDVWGFGRFEVSCGRSPVEFKGAGRSRLHVRRIVRVVGPMRRLYLGEQAVGILEAGLHFGTSSPLVVLFDPPPSDVVSLGVSSEPQPGRDCRLWRMVADAWQLDVTYSTAPPHVAHPEWSAAILRDIDKGNVHPGMTHAMVAWAFGFPNQPGTLDELMRARDWEYDAPPPSAASVTFSGDRVVRYDPGRMLP